LREVAVEDQHAIAALRHKALGVVAAAVEAGGARLARSLLPAQLEPIIVGSTDPDGVLRSQALEDVVGFLDNRVGTGRLAAVEELIVTAASLRRRASDRWADRIRDAIALLTSLKKEPTAEQELVESISMLSAALFELLQSMEDSEGVVLRATPILPLPDQRALLDEARVHIAIANDRDRDAAM